MSKIVKAFFVLRYYGPKMFIRRAYASLVNLVTPAQPEEYHIIFKAMVSAYNGGVMIDVGAGLGSALEPFAKQGWHCYAFEPNPTNRIFLTSFARRYPNVKIDNRAVSSESQQNVIFYTSVDSYGAGSLIPFLKSHKFAAKVNTVSLKDYFAEQGISRVNFLKIDTEGFDFPVLQGFPWETCLPDVIQCEFDDNKSGILNYSWRDIVRFLDERKYKILISEWKPIRRYGGIHKWRALHEYPILTIDKHGWGNIIAVQNEGLAAHIKSLFLRFKSAV